MIGIKKLWIDPESETGTIFDAHYQRLKEDHPEDFEPFKNFEPHLLIPVFLINSVLGFLVEQDDSLTEWQKGWNACLMEVNQKLMPEEITIRHVK